MGAKLQELMTYAESQGVEAMAKRDYLGFAFWAHTWAVANHLGRFRKLSPFLHFVEKAWELKADRRLKHECEAVLPWRNGHEYMIEENDGSRMFATYVGGDEWKVAGRSIQPRWDREGIWRRFPAEAKWRQAGAFT